MFEDIAEEAKSTNKNGEIDENQNQKSKENIAKEKVKQWSYCGEKLKEGFSNYANNCIKTRLHVEKRLKNNNTGPTKVEAEKDVAETVNSTTKASEEVDEKVEDVEKPSKQPPSAMLNLR